MQDLTKNAIQKALACDWKEAININKQIIEQNPHDINALNRLAFAYIQIEELTEAKKIYKKIISIDKYNLIAKKNLEKINNLPKQSKHNLSKKSQSTPLSPGLFIEEPGRTKTISLINIAPCGTLYHFNIADPVFLYTKKHSIEIRDSNKKYIGALPDDLVFRLLRLIKAGNKYSAYIKNVGKNNITIFLREEKRGKRFISQPSFTSSPPKHSHHINPHETEEQEEGNTAEEKIPHDDEEV